MVKNKGRKSKPTVKNKKRPPQGQRASQPQGRGSQPNSISQQNRRPTNARRPYSPTPEERRKQAIRRKKLKKRRKIVFYSTFLFVVVLTLVILSFTVFFKVQTITVSGKSMYDKQMILSSSGIKKNDNLLRVGKKKTAEKICTSLPYIGSVKINYRFPDTVKITVTGTSDKAVYKSGKNLVTTNDDGKVLSICSKVNNRKLLEVKGVTVKKAKIGYPIELKDKKSSEKLKMLLDGFKKYKVKDINCIDISDSSNLKAVYQNRIEIWFGSCSNLDKKMQFINKVLEKENQRSANQKGVIDLKYVKSEEDGNQKVYFRPQDATTQVATTKENK